MSKKVLALSIAIFLLAAIAISVLAQESVTVSTEINLRALPNRSSEIVRLLQPSDQITILETVTGSTVWLNGQESNQWLHVTLADGTSGYVWSGLISNPPTNAVASVSVTNPDPARYPLLVCERCNYQSLSVSEMSWYGSADASYHVSNPQAVFNLIRALPARDIWIGYDNGGFDIPADVENRYNLRFTAAINTLSGPLRYQGQLYDQLVLTNDPIEIWFMFSPSTGESYVFPFRSLVATETAAGEHNGSHLWGAYAVPWSDIEALDQTILAGV